MKGLARTLVVALALAVTVTACGSSDDSASSGGSTQTASAQTTAAETTAADATSTEAAASSDLEAIPASGCGAFPLGPPKDPDGVVAALDQEHQDQYAGYPYPVLESAWADWKPKGDGPYTVGIQWSALNTDFQTVVTKSLRKTLEADPNVGDVIFQATSDSVDVQAQVQQFEALLRKKPDLLILQPLVGPAFKDLIDKAAAEGIPTIVAIQHVDTPNAVNIATNGYQMGGRGASKLVQLMGGKGNLLVLHAVPGSGPEVQGMAALEKVLEGCPDVKVDANVTGNFVAALAKAETLKLLAAHPQPIDGIFDINSMASGAIAAFDQSGRPMPAVSMVGASKAGVGYWAEHRDTFKGVSAALSTSGFGTAIGEVASRMLAGDGIKLNTVTALIPPITSENIDTWAEDGWTLETPGAIPGPKEWIEPSYLDNLFTSGGDAAESGDTSTTG